MSDEIPWYFWPLLGVVFLLGMALNGWALSTLWNWFISPLGVRQISIPIGIGMAMFSNLLLNPDYTAKMEKYNKEIDSWHSLIDRVVLGMIFSPIFSVLFAWPISAFI